MIYSPYRPYNPYLPYQTFKNPIESGVSLDPLTSAWVTASGETDTDVINAIDAGINVMRAKGISNFYALFPYFASTESAALVEVLTLAASTKYGTVTFNSKQYAVGNGTNGFVSTISGSSLIALGATGDLSLSVICPTTEDPNTTSAIIIGGVTGINEVRVMSYNSGQVAIRHLNVSTNNFAGYAGVTQGVNTFGRTGNLVFMQRSDTGGLVSIGSNITRNLADVTAELGNWARYNGSVGDSFDKTKLCAVIYHDSTIDYDDIVEIDTAMRAKLAYY